MIDFAPRFLYRKRVFVLLAASKKNKKSTRSVPSRQGRTFCEAERIVAEGGKKCCGSNMTPPQAERIAAKGGEKAHEVCRPGRDTAVRRKRSGEAADNSAKRKDNAAKGGKRI